MSGSDIGTSAYGEDLDQSALLHMLIRVIADPKTLKYEKREIGLQGDLLIVGNSGIRVTWNLWTAKRV